jgi:hypothetical protein
VESDGALYWREHRALTPGKRGPIAFPEAARVKGDGESPISSVVILSVDFLPAGCAPVPMPGAKETPFDRESAA